MRWSRQFVKKSLHRVNIFALLKRALAQFFNYHLCSLLWGDFRKREPEIILTAT